MKATFRKKLIQAGVKNLEQFGYYGVVTDENILTDYVFSEFFKSMLQDDENVSVTAKIKEANAARLALIDEIEANRKKKKGKVTT